MTPNPQNIGAAPEGITLEVGKTYITRDGRWKAKITGFMPGSDSHWPFVGMWIGGDPTNDPGIRYATFPTWNESGAIFHEPRPTDLVAEAPSPDAVGVPEPSPAKGPSIIFGHPNEKPYQYHFNPDPDAIVQAPEVTQPGEGVDLEVTVMFRDNGDAAWWSVIEVPAAGQFKDGEMFRATLRRESK